MIAANGVTARYLSASGFPSIRRVVRTPKRWERIVEIAANYKYMLPKCRDLKALEQFLVQQKAADPLRFPDLSLTVIKLLGAGEYVAVPSRRILRVTLGWRSRIMVIQPLPNRRYPDLLTQRLLKAALAKQPVPYPIAELTELALIVQKLKTQPTKSSGRWSNPLRRCCWKRGSASSSMRLSPVLPLKAPGFGCLMSRLKAKW